MSTQYSIPAFNTGVNYKKFDAVRNIYLNGNTYNSPVFYATQDSINQFPSGIFVYPITQYNRVDDVTTLVFGQTGVIPNLVAGSIIKVTGINTDISINYTGMVIDGGSGWCKFVNAGWPTGLSLIVGGGAINCFNPAFTTGFMFVPTYSSKLDTTNSVITAKFGDGYEQRMNAGLNTFTQSWNMVFQSRSAREMKAIQIYTQDHGGVYPFQLLDPDQFITNQPTQKFTSSQASVTPMAYGLYDISVTATRVFDI